MNELKKPDRISLKYRDIFYLNFVFISMVINVWKVQNKQGRQNFCENKKKTKNLSHMMRSSIIYPPHEITIKLRYTVQHCSKSFSICIFMLYINYWPKNSRTLNYISIIYYYLHKHFPEELSLPNATYFFTIYLKSLY